MQVWAQGNPMILVRRQFQQLFRHSNDHEPLRNQLIIDLPCQMALRTKEIRMLRWEEVDVDSGHLWIRNSKSKHLYPLPLNYKLAEKLERYHRSHNGFVLRRLLGCGYSNIMRGRPISNKTIWDTWHRVAHRAQLQHPELYTPRLGRHYFAAMWMLRKGTIEGLRRILRHKNLEYTKIYLSRLVFEEDIKAEYNRIHQLPIGGQNQNLYTDQGQVQLREECLSCPAERVCRYKYELSTCEAAGPCVFRPNIIAALKETAKP